MQLHLDIIDHLSSIGYNLVKFSLVNGRLVYQRPNQFVVVVGQSGSGETTLLKLLTREEVPTSGKIIVGGIDFDKLKDSKIPQLRRKIGVRVKILNLSCLSQNDFPRSFMNTNYNFQIMIDR